MRPSLFLIMFGCFLIGWSTGVWTEKLLSAHAQLTQKEMQK